MTNNYFADYPAFPTTQDVGDVGLSKREYFAAAALQGIISNGGYANEKRAAELAVDFADALINELNKKDEDKI